MIPKATNDLQVMILEKKYEIYLNKFLRKQTHIL